tara:strand:+ start:1501 stop:2268 length:768 start_codon:yes stop_codon:yes gene_type:complete
MKKLKFDYDKIIIPSQMNSAVSNTLKEEVKFFLKWGYLIIDNALNKKQITVIQKAFNDTFQKYPRYNAIDYGLLEYDKRFLLLLNNQKVIKRIKAILGNCIQLHSATARLSKPGTPNQNWHRDGHWPVDPKGTPFGSIPGQINCGYYLDKLSMYNGPICILPGSHKANLKPPQNFKDFPDQKMILAKPGQAILFNGWIYHRGVANNSDSNRRVCLICYQNAWMKSRETFDGPLVKKLKKNGTNEQKLLLGNVDKW